MDTKLSSVVDDRRALVGPTVTPPRIEIATPAAELEAQEHNLRREMIQDTSTRLREVLTDLEARGERTWGTGVAVAVTIGVILVAVVMVFLGVALYQFGVGIDLG